MPHVTLKFTLPEEEPEFRYATLGRDALLALWDVDQRCRSALKYGEPSEETAEMLREIREMIPSELLNALE
jgi:hypothetical protein